jgi:hypothetical protein
MEQIMRDGRAGLGCGLAEFHCQPGQVHLQVNLPGTVAISAGDPPLWILRQHTDQHNRPPSALTTGPEAGALADNLIARRDTGFRRDAQPRRCAVEEKPDGDL